MPISEVKKLNQFLSKRTFDLEKLTKTYRSLILTGTGMGVALILGSFYIFSRPCVIGECSILPQAGQLIEDGSNLLATSTSDGSILAVYEKLTKAREHLQSIPLWSTYHFEADSLLKTSQSQFEDLKEITQAIKINSQAVSLSQNSPLSSSQEQEIKNLWQNAVATLEKLSPQSQFYQLAQVKIQDYQRNLLALEQRLQAEKESISHLKIAKQTAKLAISRQNSAQSKTDWGLVYATWQTVIQHLKQISPGTNSYAESRQLLNTYMPQLVTTSTRKIQEESAENLSKKAINLAKIARESESSQQWSKAVANWRNALVVLKQVPKNTFQYNQTKPLLTSYTLALKQAEINLTNGVQLQQLKSNLAKLCNQGSKICNYTLKENTITINLTSSYMQQLWQTALEAKVQGNLQTQAELLNHISRFEQDLQTISNNRKKRIEVYNSNQNLMAVYQPR
jgi:hypothetical protein